MFPPEYRGADTGAPLTAVCDVLRSQGISADPVKLDPDRIARATLPVILLTFPNNSVVDQKVGHLVLLKEVLPDGSVKILDPNNFSQDFTLSNDRLRQIWDGHAIVIDRGSSPVILIGTGVLVVTAAWLLYSSLPTSRLRHEALPGRS